MSRPIITPEMLQQSPFSIDWNSIPSPDANTSDVYEALWDICLLATSSVNRCAHQPIEAHLATETWEGPDFRCTIRRTGVAHCLTKSWPVSSVVGGQFAPAQSFPKVWVPIPATALEVSEPFNNWFPGGQYAAGSSANAINVMPGYMSWLGGRFGFSLQIAYFAGWPNAKLTASVAAGDATLSVDDVSGFAGSSPWLWDFGRLEQVYVSTVTANAPVTALPGVTAQAGPGTLTLTQPTLFAHDIGPESTVLCSMVPDEARKGAYLYAVTEALARGADTLTAPAMPGSVVSSSSPFNPIQLEKMAEREVCDLRRVI